jgi:hypothetical protein
MPSIELITGSLLDSAIYDAGEIRDRDGRFPTFASAIDANGKIETYRLPADETPAGILRAELTAITTAVSIVSAAGPGAIDVHIDYRDAEARRVRARYRVKNRFLRKPDLEMTGEIETFAAERIVFGTSATSAAT